MLKNLRYFYRIGFCAFVHVNTSQFVLVKLHSLVAFSFRAFLISSGEPSSQRIGDVPAISANCFARFHDGRLTPLTKRLTKDSDISSFFAMWACVIVFMVRILTLWLSLVNIKTAVWLIFFPVCFIYPMVNKRYGHDREK